LRLPRCARCRLPVACCTLSSDLKPAAQRPLSISLPKMMCLPLQLPHHSLLAARPPRCLPSHRPTCAPPATSSKLASECWLLCRPTPRQPPSPLPRRGRRLPAAHPSVWSSPPRPWRLPSRRPQLSRRRSHSRQAGSRRRQWSAPPCPGTPQAASRAPPPACLSGPSSGRWPSWSPRLQWPTKCSTAESPSQGLTSPRLRAA
jgi:hypothetical protein